MKIEKRDGTLGIILEFKTVKEENEETMEETAKTSITTNRRKRKRTIKICMQEA